MIADIHTGDLVIEIDMEEIGKSPKPCLLTKHDIAGQNFNLVVGRMYNIYLNIFREGGNLRNPIIDVQHLIIRTEDGEPLRLVPQVMPHHPLYPPLYHNPYFPLALYS